MMHALDDRLQAYLDNELSASEVEDLERHLSGCRACREELDELRAASDIFGAAMRELDGAPVRAPVPLQTPPSTRKPLRRTFSSAVPRAAVLLLIAAAVASATIPGSPIREWIRGLVTPSPVTEAEAPAPEPVEPVAATDPVPETGVSISPVEGVVRISVVRADPALRIRTELSDGDQAEVIAIGEATNASFRTAPGRIDVIDAGAGELRIVLPRRVVHATVEVNGTPYLSTDGERLRMLGPVLDSAAEGVLFRVHP